MTLIAEWREISAILPGLDLRPAMREAFVAYSRGQSSVPPVGELLLPDGETHIKFGHIRGDRSFVIKVATGFYGNPAKGLSTSNGLFLLFDAKTGAPLAILLDGGRLTDLRTGLAGAIAAECLSPRPVEAIGVIGTGIQARRQVENLMPVTPCRRLVVYGRSPAAAAAYRDEMEANGFSVVVASLPSDVAAQANLIVTTTPSTEPLLHARDVRAGSHITAVGADSPAKNELDPMLIARADRVIADSISQCCERGEIHHALRRGLVTASGISELGSVIAGDSPSRNSSTEITIADLTGVAVQDIVIAQTVFAALRQEKEAT